MSQKCDCILKHRIEVPFRGTGKAQVMFVGESPGRQEEEVKKPFVGEAGKMLWGACREAEFDVTDARVCNAARCLIDKKSLTPKQQRDVLTACRPFLIKNIEHFKPKLIILLGDFALRQVTKAGGITKKRGHLMWSKEFGTWCLPVFHPAYILRNRDLRPYLVEDMAFAKKFSEKGFKEENIEHRVTNTKVVSNLDFVCTMLDQSKGPVRLALDTETQGFDFVSPQSYVISFSLSYEDTAALQVFLYDVKGVLPHYRRKLKQLRYIVDHEKTRLIMQNGNYDKQHLFNEYGRARLRKPEFKSYILDLQAGAHLINENRYKQASLEQLRSSFLHEPSNWKKKFYDVVDPTNMISAPRKMITEYAGEDANSTLRIGNVIIDEVKKDRKLARYLTRLSMPVISQALFTLSRNGVYYDAAAKGAVRKTITTKVESLYNKAMKLIPEGVIAQHEKKGLAFTRRDFISDVLYSSAGYDLEPLVTTSNGKGSTAYGARLALIESRKTPQAARQFLATYDEWAEWAGMLSKGLNSLEKAVRSDGRLHSSYTTTIPVTGRASCLAKGTKITLVRDGVVEYVPIEDVKPGDTVQSVDEESLAIISQKVRMAWCTGRVVERVHIVVDYYSDKHKYSHIYCTPEHKFLCKGKRWKQAQDLTVNTLVVTGGHGFGFVCAVEREMDHANLLEVYDLEMYGYPNFIANDICVHNSSTPNLMNLPKRSKAAKEISRLIAAPNEDTVLIECDLSQAELRYMAHEAQDKEMIRVYRENGDIHTNTAQALSTRPWETMNDEEKKSARQNAKCFHPSTEFLTKQGWRTLDAISIDTEIMTATPTNDGSINLHWDKPIVAEYRKNHCKDMVMLQNEGIDIAVTPDHTMLGQRKEGNYFETTPEQLNKARYWPNAGLLNDGNATPSKLLLRLVVAVQADGSLCWNPKGTYITEIRFGFSKARKVKRLTKILNRLGASYKRARYSNGCNKPSEIFRLRGDIISLVMNWLDLDKTFSWKLLDLAPQHRSVILEEVHHWDGTQGLKNVSSYYDTTIRKNADVIQALCVITNRKSKIVTEESPCEKHSDLYRLSVSKTRRTRGGNLLAQSYAYSGNVGVLSVWSGCVVARGGPNHYRQVPIITRQSGNFGLLYGMRAEGFVAYCLKGYQLKISIRQAEKYIQDWFSVYHGVKEYHLYMQEFVEQNEYVRSPFGRIRHLPDIKSSNWGVHNEAVRQGINFPIQSAASDHAIYALAYMLQNKLIDNKDCKPVLFIHDSLGFECKADKVDHYAKIIKETMENIPIDRYFGIKLSVPIVADCQVGPNRAEMKEWKP